MVQTDSSHLQVNCSGVGWDKMSPLLVGLISVFFCVPSLAEGDRVLLIKTRGVTPQQRMEHGCRGDSGSATVTSGNSLGMR